MLWLPYITSTQYVLKEYAPPECATCDTKYTANVVNSHINAILKALILPLLVLFRLFRIVLLAIISLLPLSRVFAVAEADISQQGCLNWKERNPYHPPMDLCKRGPPGRCSTTRDFLPVGAANSQIIVIQSSAYGSAGHTLLHYHQQGDPAIWTWDFGLSLSEPFLGNKAFLEVLRKESIVTSGETARE